LRVTHQHPVLVAGDLDDRRQVGAGDHRLALEAGRYGLTQSFGRIGLDLRDGPHVALALEHARYQQGDQQRRMLARASAWR
jgi:hypothetical protein